MSAASVNPPQTQTLRVVHRQRDWGTPLLFLLLFGLLAGAVAIYAYPWTDLTYRYSRAAVPERPISERPLAAGVTNWCVDLNPYAGAKTARTPMRDDGMAGDAVAGDGIYSLQTRYASTGIRHWNVVACDSASIAFPDAPAWLRIDEPGQELTLTFDTNHHTDGGAETLLPASFITNASDQLPPLYIFGSVNDWQKGDEMTRLQDLGNGRYRLAYTVPHEGQHTAAITFLGENGNLYGFMGDGRSESWNLLQFETRQDNEIVLFEVDANAGRAAIHYDVSPNFAWLAMRGGRDALPLVIGVLAFVLAFLALKRYQLLRRPDLHAEAGCPNCGSVALIRMPRTARKRLTRYVGLNTGYYECRQCPWHGTRLVGGNNTVDLHGEQFLNRWVPVLVPLALLVVSGTSAVFLRSELSSSLSLTGSTQSGSAQTLSETESLPTQLFQETSRVFSDARGWFEGIGFPVANGDLKGNDVEPAAVQPDATRSAEVQGFSPVHYGSGASE